MPVEPLEKTCSVQLSRTELKLSHTGDKAAAHDVAAQWKALRGKPA